MTIQINESLLQALSIANMHTVYNYLKYRVGYSAINLAENEVQHLTVGLQVAEKLHRKNNPVIHALLNDAIAQLSSNTTNNNI
jgi:hypothetical protein